MFIEPGGKCCDRLSHLLLEMAEATLSDIAAATRRCPWLNQLTGANANVLCTDLLPIYLTARAVISCPLRHA